jgi:peptidoglycan/xylan/chitin deacetylase (PgdA/CDA1 family)
MILAFGFFALYELVEAPRSGAFEPVVTHGSGRAIALTFDDGPTPGVTDRLLTVLEREHVPATFFVVGRAARREPGLLRRMVANGDEIENHSDTHAHLNMLLPAALARELDRGDAAIFAITGRHTAYLRPPFGARNAAVLDAARRRGMKVVLWSVAASGPPIGAFTREEDRRAYAQELAERVDDGAIVLMHDGNRGRGDAGELAFQAEAVPYLISALRSRGDRFVTVSQLLAAR